MAIPKENRIEAKMCQMLNERGLPLPKGYKLSGRDLARADYITDDKDYDVQCLQLALLEQMSRDIRVLRRWVIGLGIVTTIAVIVASSCTSQTLEIIKRLF